MKTCCTEKLTIRVLLEHEAGLKAAIWGESRAYQKRRLIISRLKMAS